MITNISLDGITYTFGKSGINTDDATALASDILLGKTAYARGTKIEGTIPSYNKNIITPSTSDYIINSGYYINDPLTIQGDHNLIPENIRSGVSIFGVTGNAIYTGGCLAPTYQVACSLGAYSSSNGYLTFNPNAFINDDRNGSFEISGNKLICNSYGNYVIETFVYKTNNWSFAYGLDLYINGVRISQDPIQKLTRELNPSDYIQLYHRVQTDENGTWASVSAVVKITKEDIV